MKTQLIVCIYIHFNKNMMKKSYISSEIEAVQHLHAVFSATVYDVMTSPTFNQNVESNGSL